MGPELFCFAVHGLTKAVVSAARYEMKDVLSKLGSDHSAHKLSISTTQPHY